MRVYCPACNENFAAKSAKAGDAIDCLRCGTTFTVARETATKDGSAVPSTHEPHEPEPHKRTDATVGIIALICVFAGFLIPLFTILGFIASIVGLIVDGDKRFARAALLGFLVILVFNLVGFVFFV